MEEYLNYLVVLSRNLCTKYWDMGFGYPGLKECKNIPLEVLKIAAYLAIGENELRLMNNPMEEIQRRLEKVHIYYCDSTKEMVELRTHFPLQRVNNEKQIRMIAACLIQYSYFYYDRDEKDKREFLQAAFLFPYFYKLNKCSVFKIKDYKELYKKNPEYKPNGVKVTAKEILKRWEVRDRLYIENLICKADVIDMEFGANNITTKEAIIETCIIGIKIVSKKYR